MAAVSLNRRRLESSVQSDEFLRYGLGEYRSLVKPMGLLEAFYPGAPFIPCSKNAGRLPEHSGSRAILASPIACEFVEPHPNMDTLDDRCAELYREPGQ